MRFLIKRGPIVFTFLFAGLLLIHAIFTFSHQSTVRDYVSASQGASAEERAAEMSAQETSVSMLNDVAAGLTTVTVLEILLVLCGLPLLFFLLPVVSALKQRWGSSSCALSAE